MKITSFELKRFIQKHGHYSWMNQLMEEKLCNGLQKNEKVKKLLEEDLEENKFTFLLGKHINTKSFLDEVKVTNYGAHPGLKEDLFYIGLSFEHDGIKHKPYVHFYMNGTFAKTNNKASLTEKAQTITQCIAEEVFEEILKAYKRKLFKSEQRLVD